MKEDVFQRCVEDSTEAIMISDRTGRLIYVNPAWEKIYGYSKVEAMGATPRLLRSRHQGEDFYHTMWKQILDPAKGYWRGELVNRAKNGTEVPVVLTITPVRYDGEISGYMAIAIDMTEKKQLEAKIIQQDRLASVGLLASGLAHEIGTPLGVVRGRSELLLKRLADDEMASRNLTIVIQQIDRVSALINSLLNLSRDRGRKTEDCSVNAVVEETLGFLQLKIQELGAQVAVSLSEDLQAGIGHHQLEQVLINLLVNALHSMRSAYNDGRRSGHFVRIRGHRTADRVEIYVSDTGTGVSEHAKANLFRPFFTTKPVGEGTGLGLSISAQILHEAGGTIELYDTQTDGGSTFVLKLPMSSVGSGVSAETNP
jgi:two-component system, NtrC family, sensor kinase